MNSSYTKEFKCNWIIFFVKQEIIYLLKDKLTFILASASSSDIGSSIGCPRVSVAEIEQKHRSIGWWTEQRGYVDPWIFDKVVQFLLPLQWKSLHPHVIFHLNKFLEKFIKSISYYLMFNFYIIMAHLIHK